MAEPLATESPLRLTLWPPGGQIRLFRFRLWRLWCLWWLGRFAAFDSLASLYFGTFGSSSIANSFSLALLTRHDVEHKCDIIALTIRSP